MTKRINFADNIFFLNLILKQLINVSRLNTDAELFHGKILSDLTFLDSVGEQVLHSLKKNKVLIGRLEYWKDLERFIRDFGRFLEGVLKGDSAFAKSLEDYSKDIRSMQERSERNLREIRELVSSSLVSAAESDQIVSQEEFKYLLANDEEEEEG